jgi:heat shock protein HslJ
MRHVNRIPALIAALGVACGLAGPSPSGGDLAGTRWILTSLRGEAPLAGTRVTLIFDEGSVGGSAGCNQYSGRATWTDKGALTVSEVAATAMACLGPEGVMEQEAAFASALQEAATYRVQGDRLEIGGASGETILAFKLEPADV